jgi:hypothetical protein
LLVSQGVADIVQEVHDFARAAVKVAKGRPDLGLRIETAELLADRSHLVRYGNLVL